MSIFRRESLRLQHGQTFDFSIRVERDLGDVEIVQVHWLYDHEVDPFDLGKICLLLCSDRLFTDRLVRWTAAPIVLKIPLVGMLMQYCGCARLPPALG